MEGKPCLSVQIHQLVKWFQMAESPQMGLWRLGDDSQQLPYFHLRWFAQHLHHWWKPDYFTNYWSNWSKWQKIELRKRTWVERVRWLAVYFRKCVLPQQPLQDKSAGQSGRDHPNEPPDKQGAVEGKTKTWWGPQRHSNKGRHNGCDWQALEIVLYVSALRGGALMVCMIVDSSS